MGILFELLYLDSDVVKQSNKKTRSYVETLETGT